jgi:predicted HNH restriction endonuclease
LDVRIERALRSVQSLADLSRLEANVERLKASSDDVRAAIREKSIELGRALVAERTGIPLTDLSPAEEKIVRAASEYAGIQKRLGNPATRTFSQLKNRGLIGAAEVSVMKSKPTQGFTALEDADLVDLSYERIIVDHPDEFSERAQWYSRRALGLPNDTDKPPAQGASLTQVRTGQLLRWFRDRATANGGHLREFTNAEAAAAIGLTDMHRSGRVFGNIQSRIDFACYLLNLPPVGLAADEPFDLAWSQQDRNWAFPIEAMQAAARARVWRVEEFELVLREAEHLPGLAHISWKRAFSESQARVQAWAFGLEHADPNEPTAGDVHQDEVSSGKRNPIWSRDELILALDLYLRHRESPPSKTSPEVAELSAFFGRLAGVKAGSDTQTFRNVNGVYMKMMNFRRFDPEYTVDGRVGLVRGNKLEEVVWNEFHADAEKLAAVVTAIRAGIVDDVRIQPAPYWVFVCNPKKWAIDRFLDDNIEHDTWGVRPSDRERFAPGQLGIVRVGVDRRTILEREGKPSLESGIYALCEVESAVFSGTGANDEFWHEDAVREPGWPTVRIRYLRTYLNRPLTIERLRAEQPDVSPLLLDGFQAASYPISADDFHAVVALLGEDIDEVVATIHETVTSASALVALQNKYVNASPEVKERVSKYIERGSVGSKVKKELGFKCQVCEALGQEPLGFIKKNGEHYAEAHHVMPVSELQVGSLAASNIMVLCANHHRQMHYGGIHVKVSETVFEFAIDDIPVKIKRYLADV